MSGAKLVECNERNVAKASHKIGIQNIFYSYTVLLSPLAVYYITLIIPTLHCKYVVYAVCSKHV